MFSWFGRKTVAPPVAVQPVVDTSERDAKLKQQKDEFRRYVREISQFQRNQVADRVETLANHTSKAWPYFIGCISFSVGIVLITFKVYGPRHLFKHSQFYVRPLPPAISMGVVLYGLLYVCRGLIMRNRLWSLMEDYEFELKRVQAHHVQEGVDQLAWLQFVMDQLKQTAESKFDFKKLREM